MKIINILLFCGLIVYLSTAQSVQRKVLELDCRIDNRLNTSFPRTLSLRDGMIEDVDCQNYYSCKNSIYKITMNYNSTYEEVIVSVTDTETNKAIQTSFILPEEKTKDGFASSFSLSYGDVLDDPSKIADADKKGRFLRVQCDRAN